MFCFKGYHDMNEMTIQKWEHLKGKNYCLVPRMDDACVQ